MQLPSWARKIQQSWWFHFVVAALITFVGAVFECWQKSDAMSMACVKGPFISSVLYLVAIMQHSPGSASFKPDGEVNEPVKRVVELQKLAIPVKVEAGQ